MIRIKQTDLGRNTFKSGLGLKIKLNINQLSKKINSGKNMTSTELKYYSGQVLRREKNLAGLIERLEESSANYNTSNEMKTSNTSSSNTSSSNTNSSNSNSRTSSSTNSSSNTSSSIHQ